MVSCSAAQTGQPQLPAATLEVTNTSETTASYWIEVAFGGPSGEPDFVSADVDAVGAGETVITTVESEEELRQFDCVVISAVRFTAP